MDETPDYTEDSDTNPNTTASSVVGDHITADGRKRRSEATQLRRSVFGKKHAVLGESQVSTTGISFGYNSRISANPSRITGRRFDSQIPLPPWLDRPVPTFHRDKPQPTHPRHHARD